jgi:hypothetical protein
VESVDCYGYNFFSIVDTNIKLTLCKSTSQT